MGLNRAPGKCYIEIEKLDFPADRRKLLRRGFEDDGPVDLPDDQELEHCRRLVQQHPSKSENCQAHRPASAAQEVRSRRAISTHDEPRTKLIYARRLRIAQEIQRKLEETEVKQRELESRGVSVEKALRGEGGNSSYYNDGTTDFLHDEISLFYFIFFLY